MKKLVMILLLLIVTTTMAQEKKERQQRGGLANMTPEQMATLQTKKMTLALDLSQAQQDQIQALNLENAKARKSKMAERKAAKEESERKKPTSDERYAMANARLDTQLAQKAEMKNILSQEQYAKWEKMHGKRKHRRGKGKRGGRKQKSKKN